MKKARCIQCGWQIEYDIVDEVYTYKEDDLVVKYEIENNITMTQVELRRFLIDTVGSSKSIYDIRSMSTYIKGGILNDK